jgi:hypothetical protein
MFDTDSEFEDEVRRIARDFWPSAAFGGSAIIAGRERDGIFVTDDVVHLVECTTSRRKDKAQQDIAYLLTCPAQWAREAGLTAG